MICSRNEGCWVLSVRNSNENLRTKNALKKLLVLKTSRVDTSRMGMYMLHQFEKGEAITVSLPFEYTLTNGSKL